MSFELFAGIVVFALNIGGLVWAAGRFSSSVDQLSKTTERLDNTVQGIGREVINLHVDMEILKSHSGLDRRQFKDES